MGSRDRGKGQGGRAMGNRQWAMGPPPDHPKAPTSACACGAGFARPLGRALVVFGLAVAAVVAHGQTQIACNITEVKVKQLSNAVQVTLKADGLLTVHCNYDDIIQVTEGDWNKVWRQDVPLRIVNARSQVGSLVDIGLYPVNYLELRTVADSREGVGLDVRLVLYREAAFRRIKVDNLSQQWGLGDRRVVFDVVKRQSGRELVLTVWSDRREEVLAPKKPRRELDLPSELEVEFNDGRLSVTAVNAPLEAVMAEVSEATGVPIFIDDLVKRLATVRLTDVDLDRFVSAVVAGYGLTAVREDGAYLVSDGLPTSLAPYTAGRTRVFKLKHLGASTAINLLPNFLLHYLRPSASGDAVVAHGPEQLLDRIAEDLAVLDRPVQAVRVRTVVVDAHDTTASRRLWRLLRGGDRTVVAVDTERGSLGFRRGERPLERYVAAIEALDRRGKIEVRAQPALVVLPGTGAEIFVGERQYYQQLAAYWWQEEDVELRYAEAGVRLWCRPRATGSGLIETGVRVEVSTLRRGLVGAVVVDRRRVRGTMLLQSGETLILGGGLYLHQAERERHRPGPLRRVPLLGAASRAEAQGDELREVVFLLCAEQIETSQPAAAVPAPGGPLEG